MFSKNWKHFKYQKDFLSPILSSQYEKDTRNRDSSWIQFRIQSLLQEGSKDHHASPLISPVGEDRIWNTSRIHLPGPQQERRSTFFPSCLLHGLAEEHQEGAKGPGRIFLDPIHLLQVPPFYRQGLEHKKNCQHIVSHHIYASHTCLPFNFCTTKTPVAFQFKLFL